LLCNTSSSDDAEDEKDGGEDVGGGHQAAAPSALGSSKTCFCFNDRCNGPG
jgi:hypothetical protein